MTSKEAGSILSNKAATHAKLSDTADDDIEALLSPKANPSEDMLFASPTAEGRLEAALTKIGRLEDMDVQLRSQLEKLIAQRNQLNGDKAARDIEIQHLQAQVDLLEAEAAGHRSDSRPNSPREPETPRDSELDRLAGHAESLQADNTRLQEQVTQALATAASQNDKITMLQTSLTDSSSSSLEAAEKQTQRTEQELVTHRGLLTQQAAQLEGLQQKLTEQSAKAASAATAEAELRQQLDQQSGKVASAAATEAELQQKLGEQSAKAASATAAEAELRQQLRIKEAEATQRSSEFEQELEGLQKLAAAAQKQEEALQLQVATSQAAKEELQQTVVSQQQQLHLLSSKLDTEAAHKATLEQQLPAALTQAQSAQQALDARQASSGPAQMQDAASMTDRLSQSRDIGTVTEPEQLMGHSGSVSESLSQAEDGTAVAEHHDDSEHVERLTEQLSETQAKLAQMKKNTAELERIAELEQQLSSQEALAIQSRLTISLLETQAAKSETQMDALRDAYRQLQQQLGERTIVLGQKAHQIAELTSQLNKARGLPANQDALQGTEQQSNTADFTTSADQLKGDASLAQHGQNHGKASAPKAGQDASAEDDPPFTPQADPQHPQRPLFTPSDSESKSHAGTTVASTPGSAAAMSTGRQSSSTPGSISKPVSGSRLGSISASAEPQTVNGQTPASDRATASQPTAEKLSQGGSEQSWGSPQQPQGSAKQRQGSFEQPTITPDSPSPSNAKEHELSQAGLAQYAASKSSTHLQQPNVADNETSHLEQSDLQLSPNQSHLTSPRSETSDGRTDGTTDGRTAAVVHVNSVFDKAEDDKRGSSLFFAEDAEEGKMEMNSQVGIADAQLVRQLKGQVAHLKKQLHSKSQSNTSESDDQSEQLRLKLTDTQQALESATARAEGAEEDLQQAFDALQQAEALLARALIRKDAAELVALAAGCVAAFLGAAGMTVYYMH